MLIDNKIIESISTFLRADDFSVNIHGRIFDVVSKLSSEGRTVTPVTLRPIFDGDPGLDRLGGISYLARLSGDGSGLLAPREIALQIADLAARRRVSATLDNPEIPLSVAVDQLADYAARAGSTRALPIIDAAIWDTPPPSREAVWGDWIPVRQATLLTGEGGIGKSLLAQQLATSVALGRSCLGRSTSARNVLYCTVEDDPDELHRRQAAIMSGLGVASPALAGRLHLVSLAGDDCTALAQFQPDGRMASTDRWRGIERYSQEKDIKLLIIDNATDAMAGDHNDLHQVARFVNMLTGWAIERDGAVLLLHHPSKAGADWLGSVAWTNKVRNRLFIRRDPDAHDPDRRVIESAKANYGRAGDKIEFRWLDGAFIPEADLPDSIRTQLDEVSGANACNDAFLRCLDLCNAQRRNVSHQAGKNYAPRVFVRMVEGRGYDVEAFEAALERLLHINVIEVDAELWPDAHRRPRRGIRRKGATL